MNNSIEIFLPLKELSLQQVVSNYKVKENDIEQNSSFQKLSGLTEVTTRGDFPAWFFFRENRIVLIYISDSAQMSKMNAEKILAKYGEGQTLRSPGGKRARLLVYPEQGFAFSELEGEVQFVQIFQSTTLQAYKDEIYEEVGPYVK